MKASWIDDVVDAHHPIRPVHRAGTSSSRRVVNRSSGGWSSSPSLDNLMIQREHTLVLLKTHDHNLSTGKERKADTSKVAQDDCDDEGDGEELNGIPPILSFGCSHSLAKFGVSNTRLVWRKASERLLHNARDYGTATWL